MHIDIQGDLPTEEMTAAYDTISMMIIPDELLLDRTKMNRADKTAAEARMTTAIDRIVVRAIFEKETQKPV